MDEILKKLNINNRRHFLKNLGFGIGGAAMASMIDPLNLFSGGDTGNLTGLDNGPLNLPHFAPKAKRVIYLFQSGGPSQLDLFDHKPLLNDIRGEELPDWVRQGQRLTGMTSNQKNFPLVGSNFKFNQYGQSGATLSDVLPYTAKIADELCFVKSMHTEAINHDPAITFFQTGSQQP